MKRYTKIDISPAHLGGIRSRDKLLARDVDYYRKIGAKGGKALTGKKGFALNPDLAKAASRKGLATRRRFEPSSVVTRELEALAARIIGLERPKATDHKFIIAEARRIAAVELYRLGYTYQEIADALGLKSKNSVRLYLKEED